MLAMDALRYSLNIPSVQMQYLVGSQTTADFAESLGIASAEYIMGQDPGLSLALGSVPVNLTNMTQAYSTFAMQGELHPATTIIEIRDRDNRVIYTREDNGPQVSEPMTQAEAYLPHYILEGNTDPDRNLLWGERAQLNTPDGQRRPAGFKTGTTNDFRDVSGFGYVPGSLTTGVWMGNNNQEPMSNEFSGGLFSADGPLFLWHEFMEVALNQPWDWNGQHPGGADELRAAGWHRDGERLPLDRHGGDQRMRRRYHGAVPGRLRAGPRQCPRPRVPRPRAVRGADRSAGQLDRCRRHLVGPRRQRPDRGARRPRRLPGGPAGPVPDRAAVRRVWLPIRLRRARRASAIDASAERQPRTHTAA